MNKMNICLSFLIVSSGITTGCSCLNSQNVQPNRVSDTETLLESLKESAAKGYMFGHHDATIYGIGWENDENRSDIKSVCGDYPAVISFDLGHIEHNNENNLDNVSFDKIRKEIVNQYKRGGIISLSWHLDNPMTDSSSWDNSQTGVVKSILPGGENYEKFQGWMDNLAGYLETLKTEDDEKIPMFFRPWHEHSGNWFWWGQDLCTVDEYVSLWKMTKEILTEKGFDNLLYTYSPNGDCADYMEKYPGNDYVDLLGFDLYQSDNYINQEKFISLIQKNLSIMDEFNKETGKPYAITEIGYETVANPKWWTEVLDHAIGDYKPCYVLVWRNAREKGEEHYFAPYPGQLSENDFVEFYNNPKTIFLNDIIK